jgi:hypothetical protein
MNTIEKFYIIQKYLGEDDLMVESFEVMGNWGTTHYEICLYSLHNLSSQLTEKECKELDKEGIVAILDKIGNYCFKGETFDEAVNDFFEFLDGDPEFITFYIK